MYYSFFCLACLLTFINIFQYRSKALVRVPQPEENCNLLTVHSTLNSPKMAAKHNTTRVLCAILQTSTRNAKTRLRTTANIISDAMKPIASISWSISSKDLAITTGYPRVRLLAFNKVSHRAETEKGLSTSLLREILGGRVRMLI